MTHNLRDKQLAIQVHIYVVYKDRVYGVKFLFLRVYSTSVRLLRSFLIEIILVNQIKTLFKDLPNCLSNKVADDTPIIDIHAWSICVEDSGNAYFCENIIQLKKR